MGKLRGVNGLLFASEPLSRELGDHPLKGEWKPRRGLHIESDWIVIYNLDGEIVCFERIGMAAIIGYFIFAVTVGLSMVRAVLRGIK